MKNENHRSDGFAYPIDKDDFSCGNHRSSLIVVESTDHY